MNRVFSLPKELYYNRKLIWSLSKNDFRTKYAGSYLGIVWAFIQPIVTVLVYWFVFGVVRQGSPKAVPFVLWLITGLVPWFFFQEALVQSTNVLIEYSYLVKKVVFKIDILPVVKIVASLFVHLFFVVFTIFLFCCYGYFPEIYVIQLVYYSFCVFMLVLAMSYTTCAVTVFFKDLKQIIAIALQVGVWFTPIMWDFADMNINPYSKLARLLKVNPMYYVVAGYRNALVDKQWFWEHPWQTVYFWVVTIGLFVFGARLFKKLKVHFADVL
ncbi:MAG: ABC transporter permease [Lachnospiraceae bacterium]|nr:ABC transporter permease [Lachnospiraceae bacterium]